MRIPSPLGIVRVVLHSAWVAWFGLPANAATTEVGGALAADAAWSPAMGEIWVTSDVAVLPGVTLRVEAGTVVRLAAGRSIRGTNAVVRLLGTADDRVDLRPLDPEGSWGQLGIYGASGVLQVRHAELLAGRVEVVAGAEALLEDSELHGLGAGAIVHTLRPGSFTMRRCHVHHYFEILSQLALSVIEDCYLHDIAGDGIDFDGALPGSVIRACTVSHGAASNVDAIDLGNYADGTASSNVVVEACRIFDFPFDKGVSIGEAASGVVVRDCLIYGVNSGVAVKDSAEARLEHNTIAGTVHALELYEKTPGRGGGRVVAWNNVLWGHTNAVTLDVLSDLQISYSDVQGGVEGVGNVDVDPGFLEAALADFRLAPSSPVRGQALGGGDMGARWPVGSSLVDTDTDGLPDSWEECQGLDPREPGDAGLDADGDGLTNAEEYECGTDLRSASSVLRLEALVSAAGEAVLRFHGVAGRLYVVEFGPDPVAAGWELLAEVPLGQADGWVEVADTTDGGGRRFYRLRAERAR